MQTIKLADKNVSLKKYEEMFKNSLKQYNQISKLRKKFDDSQIQNLLQNDFDYDEENKNMEKSFTSSTNDCIYKFKQKLVDKINLFINKSEKQIKSLNNKMKTTVLGLRTTFSNRPELLNQINSTLETQEKSISDDIETFKKILEEDLSDVQGTVNINELNNMDSDNESIKSRRSINKDNVLFKSGKKDPENYNENMNIKSGNVSFSGEVDRNFRKQDSKTLSNDLNNENHINNHNSNARISSRKNTEKSDFNEEINLNLKNSNDNLRLNSRKNTEKSHEDNVDPNESLNKSIHSRRSHVSSKK